MIVIAVVVVGLAIAGLVAYLVVLSRRVDATLARSILVKRPNTDTGGHDVVPDVGDIFALPELYEPPPAPDEVEPPEA